MAPEKIGIYPIIKELGRGGMATVYLAKDPRFGRDVALKVLPREFLHDPQFRTRFEREAKTIAALEHSSIVPVYDVGEEEGQPYYVMRYMTGGSLSDLLKKGAMSVEQAAQVMQRLCSALDEAHAKGIVHRDLKPGNILFDKSGDPYVSDFGIAKLTQAQSSMTGSAIVGTPTYISPEQAQGTPVDGRADIYALGTILFEMLSGRTPYEADTPMALVVKHITEPVPHILDHNPNLPPAVDEIIKKAMAKNPDDRFPTAGLFAEALSAAAAGESFDIDATISKRTQIAGTRIGARRPLVGKERVADKAGPKKFNFAFIIIPVVVIAILGLGAVGLAYVNGVFPFGKAPEPTKEATLPVASPTETETPEPEPTETTTPKETVAPTEEPSPTPEPPPGPPVIGGADKIAFVANNDIWMMNMDGSDLFQLTVDRREKSDLQWLPDGNTIIYISGSCINTVEITKGIVEIITCFESAEYFEGLRVSPDGSQIAISLNRELFVVPLDLERLSQARYRSDLIDNDTCLAYSDEPIKEMRWGNDGKTMSVIFVGVSGNKRADIVRVLDISRCMDTDPLRLDEFPAQRFDFSGLSMPDFDWDGDLLFLMNSNRRNDGFGYLYTYNTETHKGIPLDPLQSCCYRDARWSPDGRYLLLAYQDERLGAGSPILLYLLPYGTITAGGVYEPIALPDGFFENLREKPQSAFRPAQP